MAFLIFACFAIVFGFVISEFCCACPSFFRFVSFCVFFAARRSCSTFRSARASSCFSFIASWKAFLDAFAAIRASQDVAPPVSGFMKLAALCVAGAFQERPDALPTTCWYVGRLAFRNLSTSCSSTSSLSSSPFVSTSRTRFLLGLPAAKPRISDPVMNVSCAGTHGSAVMTMGIVTGTLFDGTRAGTQCASAAESGGSRILFLFFLACTIPKKPVSFYRPAAFVARQKLLDRQISNSIIADCLPVDTHWFLFLGAFSSLSRSTLLASPRFTARGRGRRKTRWRVCGGRAVRMSARAAARAVRRGWSTTRAAAVETCSHNPSSVNGRAARWTFAATFATTPFALEAGSQLAAAWNTPLLSPPELRRIAHDLGAKKRIRIEGPNVPHSVAVLVPLCHCETTGEPHVLFTVANDDFGAPHVFFPRAPIARTVRPRDAHSVGDAIKLAFRTLGLEDDLGGGADSGAEKVSTKTLPSLYARLEILGLTSDCPDIATQTAVTPVVGYLGTIDVPGLRAKSLAKSLIEKTPTLMAMSLDHLLSRQSIDARVVPGIGPMPVFNATTSKDSPLQIWGLTAQILHGVLRVVVGPRSEYAEALYGPFARRAREVA